MGVKVEKYIPEIGFMYDVYEDAGSWFLAANGELQVYLGVPDEDDQSRLMAEYGAGQFIRAMHDPLPVLPPQPDTEAGLRPGKWYREHTAAQLRAEYNRRDLLVPLGQEENVEALAEGLNEDDKKYDENGEEEDK